MNVSLRKFVDKFYKKTRKDLFSVFLEYSLERIKKNGHLAFMTPFVWMFLKSYKELRDILLKYKTISSLIQLEYSAFSEATVPICTLTLRNYYFEDIKGEYIKLSDFSGAINQPLKVIEAIENDNVYYRYRKSSQEFTNIPYNPISFSATKKLTKTFNNPSFDNYYVSDSLNLTGNNKKHLRMFWEVEKNNVGKDKEWLFYAKGGGYRKWAGNLTYLINWSDEAIEHYRNDKTARIIPEYLWYKKGITWGFVTSSSPSFRVLPTNATFDVGGASVFFDDYTDYNLYLGFLNSNVCLNLLETINPTLNLQMYNIGALPIININEANKNQIKKIVEENIVLSMIDWNSFETSWEFKKHPLLIYKKTAQTIEDAFNKWSKFAGKQFYQLKENEEELNKIFIFIYGLEEELTSEVDEDDVTIRKADRERDIKSFISYAVGCMLGRYSLDEEGLVYAGGEFDKARYESFKVDGDGVLPVLDDEYFDDDILARFIEFLKITFGEENLTENIDYIAETLGRRARETSRQAIRRYFVNDFYKDHVQRYNKSPIYWLFQSDGRRKAFNALIYMHRYDSGTVSRVRTDYLHELQKKIEAEKIRLQDIIDSDLSTSEKNKAKKKLDKLDKDTEELLKYDELVNHLANQQIEIDLDDGVLENYDKFTDVLARI